MSKKNIKGDDSADLRKRAEEKVRTDEARTNESLSPEECVHLLHELRVHQIELEMQNEELSLTQEKLEASRSRYFDLYDLAPVGYCTISEKGLILEANLTVTAMLGSPKSSLRNIPLTRYILPEDQDIYYLDCKRLFETGERQVFEIRMRRLDDTLFWARIEAAAAQDPDGAPVCRIVMSDVTERRQAEAALQQAHDELEHRVAMRTKELTRANEELRESEGKHRLLFESAGDAIFIHDAEARILAVNSLACERLGYTHAELMSMRINQVDSPAEGHHAPDRIARLMAEGHLSFETVHQRKDGSHIPIEVSAQKIIWDGQPAMMTICRDITERKQAEDEKERLQAQLNQAQKMEALGTLVAGVAHEINNPISIILFNAPLLRKIWSDVQPVIEDRAAVEPQRKYGGLPYEFLKKGLERLLEDVELAGNRIAAIVKGLKDFAKKSDVTEREPMALNDAVENAFRLAQSTLAKSGIEVRTTLGRGLPEMQGDLRSIEQVIVNLIVNAAQAVEHDKGVIELETGFDRRRGHLFVVVRDNGKGIEPGVRGRVFDPFFTTRQSAGGTGLGLAVSYSLVKAHEGKITFKSEVGKGTTFRVSLPCQRRERAARILVVDDEEIVRDVVTGALSRERVHLVEEARNGTEAMIQMGANHPDLLILDILMPDMDGVEVCRALRNMPELSDIKVIIITGFPDHPKVKKVAEMGFTDICIKPLDLKGFVKKVNRVLGVGEVK